MSLDFYLVSVSIALLVLSAVMVVLLAVTVRGLGEMRSLRTQMRAEFGPLLRDVRDAAVNVASASDSLRTGMRGLGRMAEAVGNIGDDLEEGRRSAKGGIKFVGSLIAPWLDRFKA